MLEMVFNLEPEELRIPVSLSDINAPHRISVEALIDTGATVCFISPNLVRNLGLQTVARMWLILLGRKRARRQPVVHFQVHTANVGSMDVRAVVYDVDVFILGMD